ncbi:exodeoxyribonuclease III [Candidatus Peregrinibacteria bacterium]|nr:exodeoxyribonuclease III [Candidatus Peregrinibacteria bacterium]
MNIISWNVNGIRAVEKKGEFEKLIRNENPDILLFQETKAKEDQLSGFLKKYEEYDQFYNAAEKPGYSGTAIWIKKSFEKNVSFSHGMPNFADHEGRIARLDFDDIVIFSVYFPNGGKSEEAWEGKILFYDAFLKHINDLRKEGKHVIWAGDVNCAHEEIDIARPKENENSIGFLPEERAWVSRVIEENWIDVFRKMYPEKVIYSWWHVISRARDRNIGWRIDYVFVDEKMYSKVKEIEYVNEQMGSDHCPVKIFLDI